jgi:hypothetical protein
MRVRSAVSACILWAFASLLCFSQQALEGYRLICDQPVFDFGTIQQHASVTNVFTIRNEGDRTFPLKRIHSGCACTKAKLSARMIGPGESAELEVVFNSRGRKGRQEKRVRLIPSDRSIPALTVEMNGFVMPRR